MQVEVPLFPAASVMLIYEGVLLIVSSGVMLVVPPGAIMLAVPPGGSGGSLIRGRVIGSLFRGSMLLTIHRLCTIYDALDHDVIYCLPFSFELRHPF